MSNQKDFNNYLNACRNCIPTKNCLECDVFPDIQKLTDFAQKKIYLEMLKSKKADRENFSQIALLLGIDDKEDAIRRFEQSEKAHENNEAASNSPDDPDAPASNPVSIP